jgi:hypothetical protein
VVGTDRVGARKPTNTMMKRRMPGGGVDGTGEGGLSLEESLYRNVLGCTSTRTGIFVTFSSRVTSFPRDTLPFGSRRGEATQQSHTNDPATQPHRPYW